MWEAIREKLASGEWESKLEPFSNDRIIAFFTSPLGMGFLAVVFVLSIVLKWRVTFVVLTAGLALSVLGRYTLRGAEGGKPGVGLFLFAGGVLVVAAFAIYQLFIRED